MSLFDNLVPKGESVEHPPLMLELGRDLAYLDADDLHERIAKVRGEVAQALGFRVPKLIVKVSDLLVPPDTYQLLIRGDIAACGRLPAGKLLAIGDEKALAPLAGEAFTEPVYRLMAKAIAPSDTKGRELAIATPNCTLVTPQMLLQTHLSDVFNKRPHDLLSWGDVVFGFQQQGEFAKGVVEVLGAQDFAQVYEAHRALLREGVSILDRVAIIDALADAPGQSNAQQLARIARRRLGREIVARHVETDGRLPVVQLEPQDAATLAGSVVTLPDGRLGLSIAGGALRALLERIIATWQAATERGHDSTVLLVDGDIRGPLASVFERIGILLRVIGTDEVPADVACFDATKPEPAH